MDRDMENSMSWMSGTATPRSRLESITWTRLVGVSAKMLQQYGVTESGIKPVLNTRAAVSVTSESSGFTCWSSCEDSYCQLCDCDAATE